MYRFLILLCAAFFPALTIAQNQQGIQAFLTSILAFVNTTLIPFTVAIAFLFFIINVLRYFIIGGANDESQKKAKRLSVYGILALVLMLIFWGLILLIVNGLGLGRSVYVCPDYLPPSACPFGPNEFSNPPVGSGPGAPVIPTFGPEDMPDIPRDQTDNPAYSDFPDGQFAPAELEAAVHTEGRAAANERIYVVGTVRAQIEEDLATEIVGYEKAENEIFPSRTLTPNDRKGNIDALYFSGEIDAEHSKNAKRVIGALETYADAVEQNTNIRLARETAIEALDTYSSHLRELDKMYTKDLTGYSDEEIDEALFGGNTISQQTVLDALVQKGYADEDTFQSIKAYNTAYAQFQELQADAAARGNQPALEYAQDIEQVLDETRFDVEKFSRASFFHSQDSATVVNELLEKILRSRQ